MNVWRQTAATEPGFYLFRESIDGPTTVIEVWQLTLGMTQPRHGWGTPPMSGVPAYLAKQLHEEEVIEADAMIGYFICENDGNDVPIPIEEPEAMTPDQVKRKREATARKRKREAKAKRDAEAKGDD